jgi:hypothetical protein
MHVVGTILPESQHAMADIFLLATRDGKADFAAIYTYSLQR